MASLETLGEKLTFGIEIELLIRPKQKLLPTLEINGWTEKASRVIWNEWNEMEKEIAAIQKSSKRVAAQEKLSYRTAFSKVKEVRRSLHIALRDMLVEKQIGAGLTTVNYEKSASVDEPSLDELHAHKLRLHRWTVLTCRLGSVEIVSRSISASKEWQGESDHVFQFINENFDIYLSTGCSMHVHVSPAPLESHVYNLGQLQSILKATALYDKAITNVMPADRKENPYCQPNLAPRREKRHQSEKDINNHIRDAFERVESQGCKGLFAPFDNLRPIQKNLIQLVFFGESRYLSWNFAHLAGSCGTIEFRRPPGVRDAAAAKHWIAFTLGFLSVPWHWHTPLIPTRRRTPPSRTYLS
ncbi:hypothetical protein LMH87_009716 [Akanthomyces muscarius]|uniref:Uncharacterized protein n=1 Tax=Akanthomyces muscarius TaxID=2231603 RepID=A0A9W8UJT6_AKAMU|nr:hypothetical protein LMH87_009716 [Akanthomyces muscarius]KAJ4153219.1 hypothetical protein LMH87_009716 [Akanthomyces muscarius]